MEARDTYRTIEPRPPSSAAGAEISGADPASGTDGGLPAVLSGVDEDEPDPPDSGPRGERGSALAARGDDGPRRDTGEGAAGFPRGPGETGP